jgi:hypothetical protein
MISAIVIGVNPVADGVESVSDQPESKYVPVVDAFGRARLLGINLSDDDRHVLISTPPGEAVLIAPDTVEELVTALRELRAEAVSRAARR